MFMTLVTIFGGMMLASFYPTVLVHGIGGDVSDMYDIQNTLNSYGVKTFALEIGNGKLDSIFWNINKQCETLNTKIGDLALTDDKINLLGVSQGGLIARCYVERYAHQTKRVNSLVTYGTPHMGIYLSWIELKNLEYWKDPFDFDAYLANNDFLVYLNNEKPHTHMAQYRSNLLSLNHFLIAWSSIDSVISPIQSSKFEFYNISLAEERNTLEVVPLDQSEDYKHDALGLRTLNSSGRLTIKEFSCKHEEFKHPKCYDGSLMNNTLIVL
jgi:palmitoyl-protein thioesterase